MTVISSTNKGGPWVGDGKTTRYPFSFALLDRSSIHAYVDGAEVYNFTVEHAEGQEGGYVVFNEAPAKGVGLAIARKEAITQTTDIQNNTAFYPEIIETALDKLTMICQELAEIASRSITSDISSNMTPQELLNTLLQAQSVAAREAERAEDAADDAEQWARRAEHSVASNVITYEDLGAVAPVNPNVPAE